MLGRNLVLGPDALENFVGEGWVAAGKGMVENQSVFSKGKFGIAVGSNSNLSKNIGSATNSLAPEIKRNTETLYLCFLEPLVCMILACTSNILHLGKDSSFRIGTLPQSFFLTGM